MGNDLITQKHGDESFHILKKKNLWWDEKNSVNLHIPAVHRSLVPSD